MPGLTEYLKSLSSLESKETTPLTLVLSGTLLEDLNVWQATSDLALDETSAFHYLYQWLSAHGKRVTTLKLQEYNPALLEEAGNRKYLRWISDYNRNRRNQAQASEGYLSYHWSRGECVNHDPHYDAYDASGFIGITRLPKPLHDNEGALAAEPHSRFLNGIFQRLPQVKFLLLADCVFASKRFVLSFENAFPALTHFSQSASQMQDTERETFFAAHQTLLEVTLHRQPLFLQDGIILAQSLEKTQRHLRQLALMGLDHEPQKSLLSALAALDAQQEQVLQVSVVSPDQDYTVSVQAHLVAERAERKLQAEQEAVRQKALEVAKRQEEILAQERAVEQAREDRINQLLSRNNLFEEAKKAIATNPKFLEMLLSTGSSHRHALLTKAQSEESLTWDELHFDYENQLMRVLSATLADRDENLSWDQVSDKITELKERKTDNIRKKMIAFYKKQPVEFFEGNVKDPALRADKMIKVSLRCPIVDDFFSQNHTLPDRAARQALVSKLDEVIKKIEEAKHGQQWCLQKFQEVVYIRDGKARALQQGFTANWDSYIVPTTLYKEGSDMCSRLLVCHWLQEEVTEERREGDNVVRITRIFADLDRLLLFAWAQYQDAEGICEENIRDSIRLLIERGAWPHVTIPDQESRGSVHHQVTVALRDSRLQYKAKTILPILEEGLKRLSLFDDYPHFDLLAKIGNAMKRHVDEYAVAFTRKLSGFSFLRFIYQGHYRERAEELSQHYDIFRLLSRYLKQEAMVSLAAQGKTCAENAKRGLLGRSTLHVPLIAQYQEFIDTLERSKGLYEGCREVYHEYRALLNANSERASEQDARSLLERMQGPREAYQAEAETRIALEESKQGQQEAERKFQEEQRARLEEQRAREAAERKQQEEQKAREAAEAKVRRLEAEMARMQAHFRGDAVGSPTDILDDELSAIHTAVPTMFFSPAP